ncbi:aminoglycoside phosphotransferase family protein [Streptomyces sp. AJS327]|uniref:aminoglycoside phosphotransferase family protein n=1 Tax=Streptomyces sp. AJS327 TaxID=2545265 RepID=UPI0015DDFAAA|nr:aminoglycoside phosphotransferase family protein [Streptomyces sp. AJS327]MBA0051198.1 aminoglycoside phosphotransferase family protein [Streptomyces sp. AJS327]
MPDELRIEPGADHVRQLLAAQTPQWAGLPLERVASAGVNNTIYRLGADLAVRLPQTAWAADHIRKERRWLPRHAPRLPLEVPEPVHHGAPGEGFPWPWLVCRWLEGENAVAAPVADEPAVGRALAGFVGALRALPTAGGPRAGPHSGMRGTPLPVRDGVVREALARLDGVLDVTAATALWESALRVPPWRRAPVWVHSDIHPGNVLVRGGLPSAVIDWELLSVGDPALDVMAAWTFLSPVGRAEFRTSLPVDEHTWARARGWALCVGALATAHYRERNPVLAGFSRRAAEEAVADFTHGR